MVTLINAFVLEFFFFLAEYEGYEDQDGLSKAKFDKVLRMKFINTTILIIVVNWIGN
jgi:hypothetical protein